MLQNHIDQTNKQLREQVNDLLKGHGSTTGIGLQSLTGTSMEQNAPNPFSGETVFKFNLPQQVKSAYMTV